jgi:hypothetical protein
MDIATYKNLGIKKGYLGTISTKAKQAINFIHEEQAYGITHYCLLADIVGNSFDKDPDIQEFILIQYKLYLINFNRT